MTHQILCCQPKILLLARVKINCREMTKLSPERLQGKRELLNPGNPFKTDLSVFLCGGAHFECQYLVILLVLSSNIMILLVFECQYCDIA